jgi:hypothetical protein
MDWIAMSLEARNLAAAEGPPPADSEPAVNGWR